MSSQMSARRGDVWQLWNADICWVYYNACNVNIPAIIKFEDNLLTLAIIPTNNNTFMNLR